MERLFLLAAFELFVGGGGRLTSLGPVSLRMVLFGICLLTWLFFAIYQPRRRADGQALAIGLMLAYLLTHLPPLIVGTLKGFEFGKMVSELQQSFYWLAAPFFAMCLTTREMVTRTARLVQWAGVTLAVLYIFFIIALFAGLISFATLVDWVTDSNEFFFRGTSFFFYKGFLYLGLAALFFVVTRVPKWKRMALLISVALVLTLTRGFILSTSIAIFLALVAQRRWKAVAVTVVGVAIAAAMVWVYLPQTDESMSSQRDTSTSQRIEDTKYIAHNATLGTLFYGEGFASRINNRYNIENTFLWALWKLGSPGLLFWLLPFALCSYYYWRLPKADPAMPLASAYFFGTVLLYLQTATNPFLNNPIGLSYAIIALFSLRTLARTTPLATDVSDAAVGASMRADGDLATPSS